MKFIVFLLLTVCSINLVHAQRDSINFKKGTRQTTAKPFTDKDSIYMAKLNNSANLMIGAGVGLCVVGGYLTYEGVKVYNTKPAPGPTAADDLERNHKQGTIYLACAGVGIAGGLVLAGLGARNKIDFKRRKKLLSIQAGLLDTGNLGLNLSF